MKLMIVLCLAVVAAAHQDHEHSQHKTGLRLRVTKRATDKFIELSRQLVKGAIQNKEKLIQLLPRYPMRVRKLEISRQELPEVRINFQQPNRIELVLKGGDVEAEIEGAYTQSRQRPSQWTEAKGKASFKNIDAKLSVEITKENNRFKLEQPKCNIQVESIQAQYNGQPQSQPQVEKICQAFKQAIQKLNQIQQRIPLMAPLNGYRSSNNYYLNLEPTQEPKVTENYVQVDLRAQLQTGPQASQEQQPFNPARLQDEGDYSRMLHMLLSDEVINVAMRELHRNGDLEVEINENSQIGQQLKKKMIEANSQLQWNIQPEQQLRWTVRCTQTPQFRYQQGKAQLSCQDTEVKCHRKAPGQNEITAVAKFDVQIESTAEVQEQSEQQTLPKVQIRVQVPKLTLKSVENAEGLNGQGQSQQQQQQKFRIVEQKLKTFIERQSNQAFEFVERQQEKMEQWLQTSYPEYQVVFVKNAKIESRPNTGEYAFDVKVNAQKALKTGIDMMRNQPRRGLRPQYQRDQ